MIQATHNVTFVLIPNQDVAVYTAEQNRLASIGEQSTKLVRQF
jgi:hypothetical protein